MEIWSTVYVQRFDSMKGEEGIALGVTESNYSLLSALQTSQLMFHILMISYSWYVNQSLIDIITF